SRLWWFCSRDIWRRRPGWRGHTRGKRGDKTRIAEDARPSHASSCVPKHAIAAGPVVGELPFITQAVRGIVDAYAAYSLRIELADIVSAVARIIDAEARPVAVDVCALIARFSAVPAHRRVAIHSKSMLVSATESARVKVAFELPRGEGQNAQALA